MASFDFRTDSSRDAVNLSELTMYHDLMILRARYGKAAVPLSNGLSAVASRHPADIAYNMGYLTSGAAGENAGHSWSDARYDARDPSTQETILGAPARLGLYPASGYEVLSLSVNPVQNWSNSPGHLNVIIADFATVGVGSSEVPLGFELRQNGQVYSGYTASYGIHTAWFGFTPDPAGAPWIVGSEAGDSATLTAFADKVNALGGSDSIVAGDGNDALYGNAGSDTLMGNAGADTLFGGVDADMIYGGQGDDVVNGNNANDLVLGDRGNDTVHGGQNDDTLYGGQNEDFLSGDLGNDWLSGDLGNDTLRGGAGADVFVFRSNGGTDMIMDFNAGEGDRISLNGAPHNVSSSAGSVLLDLGGGNTLTLAGVAASSFSAGWVIA